MVSVVSGETHEEQSHAISINSIYCDSDSNSDIMNEFKNIKHETIHVYSNFIGAESIDGHKTI